MVFETIAVQALGILTAKTVPPVINYLSDRLKVALENRKARPEAEKLKEEIESLKKQLENKGTISEEDIRKTESSVEKIENLQNRYGLEIISGNSHKQWLLDQFQRLDRFSGSDSSFRTRVWTQDKSTSTPKDISIVPAASSAGYRIGDNIRIYFQANRDCYLTLFNLGTSGAINMLFPNRLFRDNFIRGNTVHTIPGEGYPFDYVLSGPPGTERIRAIASLKNINLAEIDIPVGSDIFYKAEKSAAAKDIMIVEKSLDRYPPDNFATASHEFIVGN